MKRVRAALKVVAINLFVLVVVLCVVEGAAHWVLLIDQSREPNSPITERAHTDYDALLGWVNVPGAHIPDMYGPGASLTLDDRGFRGTSGFADSVPRGGVRIVCAGDSFTLGFGVGDDQTWCSLMNDPALGIETVNMGQGGYGVDQAYLWYSRDASFEHDLLIFAFIGDDFARMRGPRFIGYDKPVLALDGDSIVPGNYPVPRTSFEAPPGTTLGSRLGSIASGLKTVELGDKVLRKLGLRTDGGTQGGSSPRTDPATADEEEILRRMLRTLRRTTESRGAHLVAVYLPTEWDYTRSTFDQWRDIVRSEAESGGWPFWDLTDSLRAVPPTDYGQLFLHGAGTVEAADGHYTIEGNEWAAGHIRALLDAWTAWPLAPRRP